MRREWKPGDVATCSGEIVVRTDNDEWVWALTGGVAHRQDRVSSEARPLVVIDPEDREQVERLMALLKSQDQAPEAVDIMQAALREFASPTPPKPDEPTGLGAVVECADGSTWVRTDLHLANNWVHAGFGSRSSYADIAAVRVLSEGVA